MTDTKLRQLMSLETLEQGLFRGQSWDLGFKALFGGQVLGQAVGAAQQTVNKDRYIHSFHSYFLLPGDAHSPVVYDVEVIRDGGSFSTRRVKAIQHGRTIFYMTASFQVSESGLEFQYASMPEAPGPETLQQDIRFYEKYMDSLPVSMREKLEYHRPLDIRSVTSVNPLKPKPCDPVKLVWMRAVEQVQQNPAMHAQMLAYASDYYFLLTAIQPHGLSILKDKMIMATIDHAMWFHRPIDFNQWLLYSAVSPVMGAARATVTGQFFDVQGNLVASTMQEGLVRKLADN